MGKFMLKRLSISNYALIEQIELQLQSGLTVLTGETGSGKSIIMGALGMIQGKRADTQLVKDPERKCIVEAIFSMDLERFRAFFLSHDLDLDDEITIRREISSRGKSRAFINDTPVKLPILTSLCDELLDLHSQHDNLSLGDKDFLIATLDEVAGQKQSSQQYRSAFRQWNALKFELEELKEKEKEARLNEDYLLFQLKELEDLDFESIDTESVEEELATLSNAEEIKEVLSSAYTQLEFSDDSLLSALKDLEARIGRIASGSSKIEYFKERLNSAAVDLKDIAEEINDYEESLSVDESRRQELEAINDRLNQLVLKHRLNNSSELIPLKEKLEKEVSELGSLDRNIAQKEKELIDLEEDLGNLAEILSQGRRKAADLLNSETVKRLAELKMPHAELIFSLEPVDQLLANGSDELQLLFRANKGGEAQNIRKVASGGEMSRITLALKEVISSHQSLPTLILDEIDSGVSGESAERMGSLMKRISKNSQVITITHLPQVAALANHHFKVEKQTRAKDTLTGIYKLNEEERVMELATLLSGSKTTDAALENARNLLRTSD